MIRRALLAMLVATTLVHLATRIAIGVSRCYPTHCIGGPRW
jgi:hypothetical protein